MEQLLTTILTEWWLIYMLFFMIVWGFILKWIPYLASKFEAIILNFNKTLEDQQETFKLSLNKISEDFVKQIEKSNVWHEKHSSQLDEIKNLLVKK